MRTLWAGILAAAVAIASAQQPPVFRSEVASVHVDVFVSDGGRSVSGLKAGQFELRDKGVVQTLELVSAESRPVQATLVFDTSSSVAGEKLVALRAAGAAFLDGLRKGDEVSLMSFSEELAWQAEATPDKGRVREALGRLRPEGATAVFDALYAALALADPQGRSLIVLFTDGNDNSSVLGERQLRSAAQRSNALIHVVGLREAAATVAGSAPELDGKLGLGSRAGIRTAASPVPAGESEQVRALREIAEDSGGRFWTAESPGRLREAFAAIAASLSQRYVLRYEPQGVPRDGWHELSVRLKGAKGRVQARRGYWVGAAQHEARETP
jgi:VWFA-related protein